jgi:hypothetical protein
MIIHGTIYGLNILMLNPLYSAVFTKNTEAEYDSITWYDERPKPTWAQIEIARRVPSDYHIFDADNCVWVWQMSGHVESRCDEVESMHNAQHEIPMNYNENDYQICLHSRMSIGERTIYANMSMGDSVTYPWGILYQTWRDANNTDVIFSTAESFRLFAKAANDHCNTLWATRCTHKDSLRALTTFENVRDYDISTGW